MFTLDDKFLTELGLEGLPPEQREPFLRDVYNELELRTGAALAEGLSDEDLEEFEAIIDGRDEVTVSWMERHRPDFLADPMFSRVRGALPSDTPIVDVVREYASTAWLELNRPDYRDVVAHILDGLKREIIEHRAAILAGWARM